MPSNQVEKQVEFEIGQRTYRVAVNIFQGGPFREIDGYNSLQENVGIYTDQISGEKVFIAWNRIPVLRIGKP
jgi:hypothetical protein